ncbi:MAG: hypothetical protein KAH97_08915, partial [Anaerolineales bacterium]|nr:hypothetical protein [Anaerolineales bacterium]
FFRFSQNKKNPPTPKASNRTCEFEPTYEDLRMKALNSGDSICSRSQLIFMRTGMKRWLQAIDKYRIDRLAFI